MNTVKWSFYLASSWFWCIGGFFPVLLMAEFGSVAFIPFFLSNVIGAAAFGFVFNEQRRAAFIQRFDWYAQAFSVVIICYHLIFITWISLLAQSLLPLIAFFIIIFVFSLKFFRLSTISIGLLLLTIVLFYFAVTEHPIPNNVILTNSDGIGHYVIPIVFGFLVAPYFDLTFHRAFVSCNSPKLVFFIGFVVLFSTFLAGMYFVAPVLSSLWVNDIVTSKVSLACIISLLTLQTAFTTVAHLKELSGTVWLSKKILTKLVAVVGISLAIHFSVFMIKSEQLFNIGDLFYRFFLFIIGTVFPIVLLFGRVNRYALAAISIVGVCYTLGFIIGGPLTPFLTVGVISFVAIYAVYIFNERRQHN